jgi:hypothetical protein
MNKQEAFDVAMMAGLVGSDLKNIDKSTIESRAQPANRIDINKFIAPFVGNQQKNSYGGSTPNALMEKAAEDAMRRALMEVPDVPSFVPDTGGAPAYVPPPQFIPQPVAPQPATPSISNEDIQIIKSQLEKINTNLTKMSGMFGKVFSTITSTNKCACKNGK